MELECTFDDTDVIVIDSGTRYLKVGFNGEDFPRAVIATATAEAVMQEQNEDEVHDTQVAKKTTFYGDAAMHEEAAVWPIERGVIEKEKEMEDLWEHALRNVLEVEQLEEATVLLTDTPLNSMKKREWMTELFFDKFKVRNLGIFNSSVLSLFSTGLTRGLVVESGEGVTQAVPIFEGYAISHAIFKMPIAGQDVTQRLLDLTTSRGLCSSSLRVAQAMKEKVCSVAVDYNQAIQLPDPEDEEARSFDLPDGTVIQIPHDIRMAAPEVLFDGELNLPRICEQAIETVDLDFQKDLVRSVVIAGGTSMLPGLQERIKHDLEGRLPELGRHVEVFADSQRKHSAWIGGSMLASLSTFEQHIAITRAEYEEGGRAENRDGIRRSEGGAVAARKTFFF